MMPHWEYKFVFRDNRMAEGFFDLIAAQKEICGYRCSSKGEEENLDHYFDSPDLTLESQGIVCRVRQNKKNDPCSLAVKRQALGPNQEIIYPQTDPLPLGAGDFSGISKGEFPSSVGPLLNLLTGSTALTHILTLQVSRRILELKIDGDSLAYLNLDRIRVKLPGSEQMIAEDYEIELKSERESFPEADVLKDILCNAFGMIPITRSKLRRMARLIRQREDHKPRKVILDMDTGVDDALALLLAMQSPELEVLGVTVVGGNIDVDQTARNTAAVLSHIHPFVKDRYPRLPLVAIGEKRPSGRPSAADVHGPDGLGGVCDNYLKQGAEQLIKESALSLFTEIIDAHPVGAITLITTGPLTNVAHWIQECPETVKKLCKVICMGGVFFQAGNRSPCAEFNIHFDPSSARKVVEFCRAPVSTGLGQRRETLPLAFVGLDVTHQVRLRRSLLERALSFAKDNRPKFVRDVTRYYMDFYNRNEGLDGCYLHDPLTVGYAIDPSLCQAEQYHVEVEDKGEFTSGMTVADYRPTRIFKDKMKEVTWVCYKVDSTLFEKLFRKRVLGI
ncbi:MAG: nucleoside hydrolase [Deltaproteobacteria bacterium]|nr:nucleoside hydrolase [Deltaproteobacteria bacterium]